MNMARLDECPEQNELDCNDGELRGLVTRDSRAVALKGTRIESTLVGRSLEVTVAQRYVNEEKIPLEVLYVFPLPEEAAVCGLTIRQDGRTLCARIEERDEAFDIYDEAMAEGDGAVLLDQERPNIFQMSVGNLPAGHEVIVETRFVATVETEGEKIRVSIPTTVAPRYSSVEAGPEEQAERERITPPYAFDVPYGLVFRLDAEIGGGVRAVESPSHPIRCELNEGRATVTFSHAVVAPDRDIVILVEPREKPAGAAHVARFNGREHVLAEFRP